MEYRARGIPTKRARYTHAQVRLTCQVYQWAKSKHERGLLKSTREAHPRVGYTRARSTQYSYLASLPIVSLKATFGLPEITGQLYSVRIL